MKRYEPEILAKNYPVQSVIPMGGWRAACVEPALKPAPPHTFWLLAEKLLAGPHPVTMDALAANKPLLEELLSAGVTTFFDLSEPGELPGYQTALDKIAAQSRRALRRRSYPIPDYGLPSILQLAAILADLKVAIDNKEVVYLHCLGGCGRTGTVAGAWLVEQGRSGTEALLDLARLRGDLIGVCPETEEQRNFVRSWSPTVRIA